MTFDGSNRAVLAKAVTSAARAGVEQILAQDLSPEHEARRIGFTGPPGSGKSTLIASWAEHRLKSDRSVAVLAIDPSSPISQGAILGDRIRMGSMDTREKFFIRSVASTRLHDGLCHNALGILSVFDRWGFDDAVLETVGVGQTECNIRFITGTVVLVLPPNSGDVIQAMKAGIMEIADIHVVNKCDLPGSRTLARELNSVLAMRSGASTWSPKVIEVSSTAGSGLGELDAAIDEHYLWYRENSDRKTILRKRIEYQLAETVSHQFESLLRDTDLDRFQSLGAAYTELLSGLKQPDG
ncbi:MAG: ATP/GTP-binding protein [Gammaproteobacteria bacterium]|nr:ATP/GTP-binding protein [Gammaproteobacteria bacterium]MDE0366382.1 ATP/GTP-binding protein [Gammaproteobacteria bacterium]